MRFLKKILAFLVMMSVALSALPFVSFAGMEEDYSDASERAGSFANIFKHTGDSFTFSDFIRKSSDYETNFVQEGTAFISKVTEGGESFFKILKTQKLSSGDENNSFYDVRLIDTYVNVTTNTSAAYHAKAYEAYKEYAGRGFVFSMDLKLGENMNTTSYHVKLFNFMNSWINASGVEWFSPVAMNTMTGELSSYNADAGSYDSLGISLSKDVYKKLSVFVEPMKNEFTVYVDGVKVKTAKMMNDTSLGKILGDCPEISDKAVVDVTGMTAEEARVAQGRSYVPTQVRLFQYMKCDLFADNIEWLYYKESNVDSYKVRVEGTDYYFDYKLDLPKEFLAATGGIIKVTTPSGAVLNKTVADCITTSDGLLKLSVPLGAGDRVGNITLELTDSSSGKYSLYANGRPQDKSVISVEDVIEEMETVTAEIMMVYGGAKGIVSMTYDDGLYDSALIIDELCEKYDLYASLMMIASKIKEENGTLKKWRDLFANGRLEPQNHSMTHMPFRDYDTDNLKEENYVYEILDSYDKLVEFFPEYDIITYAIPHGGWVTDAAEVSMTKYYMVRSTSGGDQTLDPSCDLYVTGSWSKLRSPVVKVNAGTDQLQMLKGYIDKAAEGYWYCPIAHGVGDVSNTEIPYDVLDAWFAYIAEVRDRGDIWVTTASAATKYIRERQNSTVTAAFNNGALTVKIDMAEKTADGLTLDPKVFDQPLTVKVELPDGYKKVAYTVGGECRVASAAFDGSGSYALVDVVPDGKEVTLFPVSETAEAHSFTAVAGTPATCMSEGALAHKHCESCGNNYDENGNKLDSIVIPVTSHTLTDVPSKNPTCTEDGYRTHKKCDVCEKLFDKGGVEIESATVPGGHRLRDVAAKEATVEDEGNIAHKHCTACQKNFDLDGNELASVSVPKLPTPAPEGTSAVVIAAVLAGGAVVVGGGSWALWFVLKRKRI